MWFNDFYCFSLGFSMVFAFRRVLCSSSFGSFFASFLASMFCRFFVWFWGHFGRLLGVKNRHFGHWFFASTFDRFLVLFWGHLGRLFGDFGGSKSVTLGIGFWMILAWRSQSGPRASKSGPIPRPRGAPEPPRAARRGQKRLFFPTLLCFFTALA